MRPFLALILLVPFLAFSLVKPGTMLTTDSHGRVMVILCGDAAPVEMAVAADGTLTPAKELPGHGLVHGSCDWAPHAQSALDIGGAILPVPVRMVGFAPPDVMPRAVVQSRTPLSLVARGPPIFV